MSRVWTYIINKELSAEEISVLAANGNDFVNAWTAHDNKLTATFEIFKNRILIVKVNEDIHAASGCSIDKLTRFIRELEVKFSLQLLNRLLVAYKNGEKIEVVHSSQIKELLEQKIISESTIVYNTSL